MSDPGKAQSGGLICRPPEKAPGSPVFGLDKRATSGIKTPSTIISICYKFHLSRRTGIMSTKNQRWRHRATRTAKVGDRPKRLFWGSGTADDLFSTWLAATTSARSTGRPTDQKRDRAGGGRGARPTLGYFYKTLPD